MSAVITEPVHVTVSLDAAGGEALRLLAESKGQTVSETVRAAIATELYLWNEQISGSAIMVHRWDGARVQIKLRHGGEQ